MVEQYPHTITVTWKPNATQSSGNWTDSAETLSYVSDCRAERNGKGETISGTDGAHIAYTHTVYMPPCGVVIPIGALVTVTLSNSEIVTSYVKGFSNGQLNTRLWL